MAKNFDIVKYIHGHTYYLGSVVAAGLAILILVQAILTHIDGLLNIAALEYFSAVLVATIAYRFSRRGGKHYKYEI